MRFAPYLQSIDMSFVNKHYTYAEMTLGWSEPGLESVIGSYVEVGYPSGSLPLPLNPVKPFMRFVGLPVAASCLGSFNVSFSNGAVLEDTSVDIFCLPCLSQLSIRYQPYWNNDYSCQAVAAVLSWEIEPSLMNRVAKYTVNSEIGTQEVSIYDNSLVLSGIVPGENIPVTFSAYAYDGTVLGQIAFNLYTPVLQLIPSQSQESNLGYQKTMDPSGVTETYNVNHNRTLGQLTTPTQAHAQETRSLGTNLPSMNPSTVVSGNANEYVQSFDPNNYNQPFDYSDALTGAAQIAPNATATLTQTHQGNYTLIHGGTLNQTTTVNQNTQTITAPQINNTIETYNGTFNGDTFNETAINKYMQIDNEQAQINTQSIAAPTYTENTNNLQQIITGTCNVNASSINMSGNTWTHNGTIYQSGGPANLGGGGGGSAPSFYQPVKAPQQSQDTELNQLVAIVWAEAHLSNYICVNSQNYYAQNFLNDSVPQEAIAYAQANLNSTTKWAVTSDPALKAVASVIINRANQNWESFNTIPGVIANTGFDAYGGADYTNALKAINANNLSSLPQLQHVYEVVKSVYDSKTPTTNAVLYYSPVTQTIKKNPYFKWMAPENRVSVTGMSITDDFCFLVE